MYRFIFGRVVKLLPFHFVFHKEKLLIYLYIFSYLLGYIHCTGEFIVTIQLYIG
jgi:hypothetical protein